MGKVGLGTTTKAERGSVGTGRAGWDRTVVKRKDTPSESNEEKGWTRQETGVLRGHGAAKDLQGPTPSPCSRGKEPRARRAGAEQGRWAAPSRACPCVSGEDGSGQEGGTKGKKGRSHEDGKRVRGKVKGITEPTAGGVAEHAISAPGLAPLNGDPAPPLPGLPHLFSGAVGLEPPCAVAPGRRCTAKLSRVSSCVMRWWEDGHEEPHAGYGGSAPAEPPVPGCDFWGRGPGCVPLTSAGGTSRVHGSLMGPLSLAPSPCLCP